MVRDAHLAEDVTQAVFILLADKAAGSRGWDPVNGWLFRATRYCAANALKLEKRRQRHETEASMMCGTANRRGGGLAGRSFRCSMHRLGG